LLHPVDMPIQTKTTDFDKVWNITVSLRETKSNKVSKLQPLVTN